jgi:hypothetical protein
VLASESVVTKGTFPSYAFMSQGFELATIQVEKYWEPPP